MKTIQDIHQAISETEAELNNSAYTPRERKRMVDRIVFYRQIIMYIETNPTKEFLLSERDRLEELLDKIEASWKQEYSKYAQFYDKMDKSTVSKRKKEFLKEIDVPHIKLQLKTVVYLLS